LIRDISSIGSSLPTLSRDVTYRLCCGIKRQIQRSDFGTGSRHCQTTGFANADARGATARP
jgi:hypothetical protein